MEDKDILKDSHIAIQSLLQSKDQLWHFMPLWLHGRLRFTGGWPAHKLRLWMEVWTLLEVPEDLRVHMVHELQFEWDPMTRTVSVHQGLQGQDVIGLLLTSYKLLWQWANWSDSRFLGIGRPGRQWVISELSGVKDLVDYITQAPGARLWYLNGYGRGHKPGVGSFIAAAGLAAKVGDAGTKRLMTDPRLLQQVEMLKADMQESCIFPLLWFGFFVPLHTPDPRTTPEPNTPSRKPVCMTAFRRKRSQSWPATPMVHGRRLLR